MRRFVDMKAREWQVEINAELIAEIERLLGFNLLHVATVRRVHSDPVAAIDVLYVVCKTQADEIGVSDEDFGRSLATLAVSESALTALFSALIDFHPESKRKKLRRTISTMPTWFRRVPG